MQDDSHFGQLMPASTVPSEPIPAGLERRVPCAAGYADRLDPGNPCAERLRLDVIAGRRLACRRGVYQRPRMAPSPDIRRRPSGRQGSHLATVLARLAQQPEKGHKRGAGLRPVRSTPAGDHHEPHPPHLPIAGQLDQRGRFPARSPRGRARRGRRHPGRTAPLDHAPAGPARARTIATSESRVGVRPQRPRERLRTRAVPAQLPHTIQLCIHCRENPAGFWVSRTGGKTVHRPWCLSCCEGLDRDRCDDPVRELAPCHAGHDAQVPALGHADLGIPCRRTQRWRGSSPLTLVPTGFDDAAPGPRQATP